MKLPRRNFLHLLAGAAALPTVSRITWAQAYPTVPTQTGPEFIAYAKANPGKINMASVGNGTTPHMAGELFKMMAGVDMLHVPYRGAAPALTDLLGGRAQVMFEGMLSLTEHIRTGRLRALAVTTPAGAPGPPDL